MENKTNGYWVTGNTEWNFTFPGKTSTSSTFVCGNNTFLTGDTKQVFRPVPIEIEPIIKNRFIISFPEEFALDSYLFQSCSSMVWKSGKWQDIKIKFIDATSSPMAKGFQKLVEKNELTTFEITYIDESGKEISRYKVRGEVLELCLGGVDYSDDDITMNHIIISPNYIEIV